MASSAISLFRRPTSESAVAEEAEKLLRRASALGRLPTPIDDLTAAVGIEEAIDPEPLLARFLARVGSDAAAVLQAGLQKVRGLADLRQRAIYVAKEGSDRRLLFVKSHELAHQTLPWHKVNLAYRDDDLSLSAEVQEEFDQEANFFAAEVIFQGARFTKRVRDYRPSFAAIFQLADEHGASRHATAWRYIEEQDETVGLIQYWPSRYALDEAGRPALRRGKVIGSRRFVEKYESLEIPFNLPMRHPWLAARDTSDPVHGDEITLTRNGSSVRFHWEAWWNTHTLFVLLRRRPKLSLVRRVLRST